MINELKHENEISRFNVSEIKLQSKIAQRAMDRLEATKDNFDRLEV